MDFSAPIWLAALLPWLGVALYLFLGRRRKVRVPFLELWKGEPQANPPRKAMQPPPPGVVLLIVAMLLAILAAAGPRLASGRQTAHAQAITILVDRGLSMSGRGRRDLRFRELAGDAANDIQSAWGNPQVSWTAFPGDGQHVSDLSGLLAALQTLGPTAVDTRDDLIIAARQALLSTPDPVLVITDQPVDIRDPRLIVLAPAGAPENVGIALLAARAEPLAQVMVRIGNDSGQSSASLQIKSGNEQKSQTITLPTRGQSRDYFIEMPLAQTIEAGVDVSDDLPADNAAWLVRAASWPRLEIHGAVPAALERMVEVYRKNRPPGETSARVEIATASPSKEAVARVTLASAAGQIEGKIVAEDHPITRDVDWPASLAQAAIAAPPADAGWRAVVRVADHPVVAIKDGPPREVWVGFDSESMALRPDFAVFWSNVFDWLGQSGQAFQSSQPRPLDDAWGIAAGQLPAGTAQGLWPGVYRRGEKLLAINAPAYASHAAPALDWKKQLRDFHQETGRITLAPWTILAGLACALIAMAVWAKPREMLTR